MRINMGKRSEEIEKISAQLKAMGEQKTGLEKQLAQLTQDESTLKHEKIKQYR